MTGLQVPPLEPRFAPTRPMREEGEAGPVTMSVPAAAAADADDDDVATFAFTGSGSEYFRIWVVNLLLTLATLGIYSAWAKVRKASWFARNTALLGDRFEFVANPWAILRGRVLAVLLLGFYTFAFDFSLALGYVATLVLVSLAPLLFASAMRFRLQNTRWRGIRFGFAGTRGDAYRQMLPVALIWISGTVIGAAIGEFALGIAALVTALLLPWMHHRIKAYQHRRATWGGLRADFRSGLGRFYAIYLIGGLILLGAGIVAMLAISAVIGVLALLSKDAAAGAQGLWMVLIFGVGAVAMLLVYIVLWPYFATRIQRAVWDRTTLGPHAFRSDVRFGPALRIALRYGFLLLVSAGLAWPFAVVAWARYRVGSLALLSGDGTIDEAVAEVEASPSGRAIGEGAADFFGVDFGW